MDERAEFNLKLAKERLIVSKKLLDDEFYMDSVNRSYYAIFYTARALVAKDELDFSKHSAVIRYFRKNYIKTRIFDVRFSKYIGDVFDLINDGNYTYFVNIEKDDAETQYNHAAEFYEAVKNYLENLGNATEKISSKDT